MKISKKIKWVSIDKINDPWGNKEKTKQEVGRAIDKLSEHPDPFNCIKCNTLFQPAPVQWIFYNLCDHCFKQFDAQKMMGRRALLEKKNRFVMHYEDVDEWIKQPEN